MSEFWRNFEKRNPILAPALEATSHFSKTQLLMNLVLTAVAIPASWYYGILPGFQLWPTIKAVAVVYIALLVATAVCNFVRSPIQLLARNNQQIGDLRDRLDGLSQDIQAISQLPLALPSPNTPVESALAEIAATSMEYVNCDVVDRWLSPIVHGFINVEPANLTGGMRASDLKFRIMLARFYYKALRDLPPAIDVKVHIVVTDAQGTTLRPRYDAVWDVDFENVYKRFSTASTHSLSIGLLPKQDKFEFITYEYGYRDGVFAPDFIPLAGTEFLLEVELIGKVKNVTVLNAPMRFLLTLEPRPELTQLT